ncbi:MAG TPA: HAMP domain-containing sensor histidine kinase, partial [Polyangiaceae bacterium]
QALHPDREIQLDARVDARGRWEAAKLARVVSNLVGNALKHTTEHSVRVQIDGDADTVTLSVHNRGPAIAVDVMPRLFEPFRRGHTSAEGVGLGLYIVREIVRAHEGTVEVRSTPEEGTTFSVTLPRCEERPAAALSPALESAAL